MIELARVAAHLQEGAPLALGFVAFEPTAGGAAMEGSVEPPLLCGLVVSKRRALFQSPAIAGAARVRRRALLKISAAACGEVVDTIGSLGRHGPDAPDSRRPCTVATGTGSAPNTGHVGQHRTGASLVSALDDFLAVVMAHSGARIASPEMGSTCIPSSVSRLPGTCSRRGLRHGSPRASCVGATATEL